MEKFVFDDGVREFQVNGGGVLRFNPGDMNLYGRFLEAAEKIRTVETELVAAGQQASERSVASALASTEFSTS